MLRPALQNTCERVTFPLRGFVVIGASAGNFLEASHLNQTLWVAGGFAGWRRIYAGPTPASEDEA